MNVISNSSNIGKNFKIGNFNIIGENVLIGDNVEILNNVRIYGNTTISDGTKLYDGVIIGSEPQHTSFIEGFNNHRIIIGKNTILREYVTVNQNTKEETPTIIGNNCFIMSYSHISHDTIINDNTIIANSTQIGGHSFIDSFVTIGGGVLIHQNVKIGKYSMIGAGTFISKDVLPFSLVAGSPAKYQKLNLVGLRRNNFSKDQIKKIEECYRNIFSKGLNLGINELKESIKSKEEEEILDFLIKSERGVFHRSYPN